MSDIEDQVRLAIENALNTEIKEKFGEDVRRLHTIVISLVEWPREDGDGPGTPRVQVSIKTLEPVTTFTAGKMLDAASIQFQHAAKEAQEK